MFASSRSFDYGSDRSSVNAKDHSVRCSSATVGVAWAGVRVRGTPPTGAELLAGDVMSVSPPIGVAREEVDVVEDTVHSRVVVRGQDTPTGDGIKDLRPLTRSPSRRS
jgi:hypothetical protein